MDLNLFIDKYRKAFSENAELPIAFWYSDERAAPAGKQFTACIFKYLTDMRQGEIVTFCGDDAICGGAKVMWGWEDLDRRSAEFITYEKFIRTPEDYFAYHRDFPVERIDKPYLNFARIDKVTDPDALEGLFFIADGDVLAGLTSWIFLDHYGDDAIITRFNSGCSGIVTGTAHENRMGGKRAFLGGLDPSVRPLFKPGELTLSIPMSLFRELYDSFDDSCLSGTREWNAVRDRIQKA